MVITQEFAQRLLNYLATQPYGEVFQLIGELSKAAQESNQAIPAVTNDNGDGE